MLFTKNSTQSWAVGLAVLAAPVEALAAGGSDFASLAVPAFNFAIYAVLLTVVFRKYIAPQLKARSLNIREQVKISGQALRNIQADLTTLRDRLSDITSEKEEIVNNYDAEGDDLAKLIIARAQDSARQLERDTARRVEQEFKQATAEVKAEAVALAMAKVRSELAITVNTTKDGELRRNALQAIVS